MPPRASYATLEHDLTGPIRLQPGDLVGRLKSAAMCIEHPHVSEAHAYLSLRDGTLKLLALRGGLSIRGRLVREVTLAAGQQILIAHEQHLRVVEVHNPDLLLALQGPDGHRELLTGRAMSLVEGEGLVGQIVPDAALQLWTDGTGWVVQPRGGDRSPVRGGDELHAYGACYRVVEIEVSGGAVPETGLVGRLSAPLQLEGFFDTIYIHREGFSSLVISGVTARMISALAEIRQPVGWAEIARQLWPEETYPDKLRKKWDILLLRLRRRLADAHVRTNLVQPDGTGNIQLVLEPRDRFVDRS